MDQEERRPHALVLGIDGLRYDELLAARTPALDSIARTGFLVEALVDPVCPTISGPVWASIASGVMPDLHGITDNDLDGHRLADHPDFLTRIRLHDPSLLTMAAAEWAPLVSQANGGPIFTDGGYLPERCAPVMVDGRPVAVDGRPVDDVDVGDEEVTEHVVNRLGLEDVRAAFVYFHVVDIAGHRVGLGAQYRAAIERTDERIGRILSTLDARATRAQEDWTVIAVTDHGHLDGGGHGGISPQERSAWVAACGPGISARSGDGVRQVDVGLQVLDTLGVPGFEEAAGRPFAGRAA